MKLSNALLLWLCKTAQQGATPSGAGVEQAGGVHVEQHRCQLAAAAAASCLLKLAAETLCLQNGNAAC